MADSSIVLGNVGKWDLSSGDLIEHQVYDRVVFCMAVSGDMIATCNGYVIRVFNLSTCLLDDAFIM